MLQTIFVGCSYTAGSGFDKQCNEPGLWCNLLHQNISDLRRTEYINLGAPGASNELIFRTASRALLDYHPKFIIVQWSSYPRFNLLLGIETYSTKQLFAWDCKPLDHNLHKGTYSSSYLTSVRNRFLSLENPHNQIVNIVSYVNILIKLAHICDSKILFVNGLCSWDDNYFAKLDNVLPNQYTNFTQYLLDVQTRNDEEIFKLYNIIHNDYECQGGIQQSHWLNLYQSLKHHKIDVNKDLLHPGLESNKFYYNLLSPTLIEKLGS
jgi:hypothetical protein